MENSFKQVLIRAAGRTARAGFRAVANPAAPSGKKKTRRAKKGGCSPCEAMAMVDRAREQAAGGGL